MKKVILASTLIALVFTSCLKDKGSISMTYNKATAIYGSVEEIRAIPLKGQLRQIDNPGKIFVGENFILVGEEEVGIHVFDNSNPASPYNIAFIETPFTKEFSVKGNYVYAESQYDLLKIDLSTVAAPQLASRLENAFGDPIYNSNGEALLGFDFAVTTDEFKLNSPEAQALEENATLYFNHQDQLIPYSSIPSSFAGSGNDTHGTLSKLTVNNNHVYVVTSSKMYSFSDGASLTRTAETDVSSDIETIYPDGDHLYIGTKFSMIVYDASNPSSPEHVGEYDHPTSCDPVYADGNVAYLTLRTADFSGCNGDENTLEVLDISNPTNPTSIQSITMDSPYGMTVSNNRLYVGEGDNGLTIFDATNPVNPVLIKKFDAIQVYDVVPHPTNPDIILTTGDFGLEQYEVNTSNNTLNKLSDIQY